MSLELSELFRAAASDGAIAAGREFPLTQATVERYVWAARRRRAVGGALVAVAGAIVIGAGVLGVNHFWQGAPVAIMPTSTPSATWSSSVDPSDTSTPTPTPTSEPSHSATPPASPAPTAAPTSPPAIPPATPNAAPAVAVPGQVTGVTAVPGGGSGEVLVGWSAVTDATGYRVYRSSSADGPFVRSASFVVATAATSIEIGVPYEYIQIWQPSSNSFEYVESVDGARAYFRVAAFNAGGTGSRSAVVCGSPSRAPEGC